MGFGGEWGMHSRSKHIHFIGTTERGTAGLPGSGMLVRAKLGPLTTASTERTAVFQTGRFE